jgi:hypothetical protein
MLEGKPDNLPVQTPETPLEPKIPDQDYSSAVRMLLRVVPTALALTIVGLMASKPEKVVEMVESAQSGFGVGPQSLGKPLSTNRELKKKPLEDEQVKPAADLLAKIDQRILELQAFADNSSVNEDVSQDEMWQHTSHLLMFLTAVDTRRWNDQLLPHEYDRACAKAETEAMKDEALALPAGSLAVLYRGRSEVELGEDCETRCLKLRVIMQKIETNMRPDTDKTPKGDTRTSAARVTIPR